MKIKHVYILLLVLLCFSCKKDKYLAAGGNIVFSTDTLNFDTVFTSLGSYTAQVKIYNPQSEKIIISSIHLENGNSSFFHINVDGFPGNTVNNIEVAAKDSIYVFATVKIDPTDKNTPFVVEDKLIATMNGKTFQLPLIAYGQNAYYIRDSVMPTQTWKTDKPYVIIKNALVDVNQTLTIPPGCRIYMHADSRLFIAGTLKAIGTKKDSIVFQGDRLDRNYFGNEGYPGEWGGLYITSFSSGNELDYVILKNCGASTKIDDNVYAPAAIQVNPDSTNNPQYQLTMRNTTIENSIGYGLLCYASSVSAENCLFNCCGSQALAIYIGGFYRINNCDFVIYGTNKINHIDNPALAILNYRDIDDYTYESGELDGEFKNCIAWGSIETEAFINKKGPANYGLKLDNCLLKTGTIAIPTEVKTTNCILNKDPLFVDVNNWNFKLSSSSPAIDAGINIPGISSDIDGKIRSGIFDIGCYEY